MAARYRRWLDGQRSVPFGLQATQAAKRAVDVIAASLGLALLSPLLLLVAVLIRMDTPGPVLYRQTRIGQGGRPFELCKFRSMFVGADQVSRLTPTRDARITRIGRIIRAVHIDEIPQLANVLRGDMSLVGPRPEVPEFVDLRDPRWQKILSIRPGLTSPETLHFRLQGDALQAHADYVQYYRDVIRPQKLELQVAYVDQWTFWGDMRTILQTFAAIVLHVARVPRDRRDQELPTSVVLGVRVTPLRRLAFFIAVDGTIIAVAVGCAFILRFDGFVPAGVLPAYIFATAILASAVVGCLLVYDVYRASWSFMGLRDVALTGFAAAFGTFVLATVALLWSGAGQVMSFPRSIVFIQAPLTFLGLTGFRLTRRAGRLLRGRRTAPQAKRTLLVGAGPAGEQVLKSIQETAAHRHEVIGFLDDDPLAAGTLIHGVPVLGRLADLRRTAVASHADVVILCLAHAAGSMVRTLTREAHAAGISDVRIIPPVSELVDGTFSIGATRVVSLEDLLGREAVEVDVGGVRSLIVGRRVIVTGGAGTIGSELCRQVARFEPSDLIVLDLDESRLHDTVLDLRERHPGLRVHQALADVRRQEDLSAIFEQHRPELVFHAAAMKHVPMMEQFPLAALEVNVLGTVLLASTAEAHGAQRFVLISTDKAVEPSSVMGMSKRLAELVLFAGRLRTGPMVRSAVRFGNVIGSRGSVIPTFERQLAHGGPLTVTHPDIERYFMMTSEAVSLVLQAAAIGRGDDLFVLDMGKPVRILDVAREFCRLHGVEPDKDIAIVFTGLRRGEKLSEVLHYPHERLTPTDHPQVLRAPFRAAEPAEDLLAQVRDIVGRRDEEGARSLLRKVFRTLEAIS